MCACRKAQAGSAYFSAVSLDVRVGHSAYMNSPKIINHHEVSKKLGELCWLKAFCGDT